MWSDADRAKYHSKWTAEKRLEYNRNWLKRRLVEDPRYLQRRYLKHRERLLATQKQLREKRKSEIFAVLGDKCAHCGFSDVRALQLDHVNGGGSKERRENPKVKDPITSHDYRKDPTKYQLLCANCNWIKRAERREETQRRLM